MQIYDLLLRIAIFQTFTILEYQLGKSVFTSPPRPSASSRLKRDYRRFYLNRHIYVTTVCLPNDVPIETLLKMLEHRNIHTTQIYSKITAEKVSRNMGKLSQRIEQMENFICQAI